MVPQRTVQKQTVGFAARVMERAHAVRSWMCVGLDPDLARLPAGHTPDAAGVTAFCRAIVEATADLTVAFKLNFAFFEALGSEGWRALEEVRRSVPADVPVIADAKRGDIPHSARAYAAAVFDALGFDAVTVNPYLGWDAVAPFLQYDGRAAFVLCKTSNPGASALQDAYVEGEPLYLKVAREGLAHHTQGELGYVVGATQPAALAAVRALGEDLLLLVPGVGAQGAAGADTMRLAANSWGDNAIVPVSRDVLYASSGADFAAAARGAAERRARELWLEA